MKLSALLLLLAPLAFGQAISNTGPINVTTTSATVQQSFTSSATAPIAAIQYTLPPGASAPISGALGTKVLAVGPQNADGSRIVIVYGYDDIAVPTNVLSSFSVAASGTYSLSGVIAASPTATDVPTTVGAPLIVSLAFSRCDTNRDRLLTNADVDLLAAFLAKTAPIPPGTDTDINRNGVFNAGDVQLLSRVVRGLVACPQ